MKRRTVAWLFGVLALAGSGLLQSACGDRGSGAPATEEQLPGSLDQTSTALPPAGTADASTPSNAKPAPAASASQPARAPASPPPPPPPRTFTIRPDTPLEVHTTAAISTATNKAGETFLVTLAKPIADGDWVIAKQGARLEGVIVDADPGGRVKGVASMSLALRKLTLADGRTVDLSTNSVSVDAPTTKGKDAKKIGIGAGVGAAVGAIAGGGQGAAIGAAVGGGAGTAAALATRGAAAAVPSESLLTFTVTAPVSITKK